MKIALGSGTVLSASITELVSEVKCVKTERVFSVQSVPMEVCIAQKGQLALQILV